MRILIAEDESFNLIVIEEMIKIFYPAIDIVTALNGALAYDILKEDNNFDVIISDINMPIMDGYALVKKIKEELKIEIPVIAATAFAVEGDKEKILLAGFDQYISKPIDMDELGRVLAIYLNDRS